MKIYLLVIGKTDEHYLKEGIGLYVNRLKHYVQFEIIEISGLKNTKSLSPEQIMKKEGEILSEHLKKYDYCVLLDEGGKSFRSVEFSSFIETKMQQNLRSVVFVVGGAYGFDEMVNKLADMKMSLSKMTFSHQMVRLFFMEQLYRAFSIIRKEPYHNE